VAISPTELVLILRGQATEELKARFLVESDDPNSEASQLMRSAEIWGREQLNRCSASPEEDESPSTLPLPGKFRILRRAGLAPDVKAARSATLSDLIASCRGTASPEISAVVKQDLEDPASPLSLQLADLLKRDTRE
jgi:hypothetical protein